MSWTFFSQCSIYYVLNGSLISVSVCFLLYGVHSRQYQILGFIALSVISVNVMLQRERDANYLHLLQEGLWSTLYEY